MKTQLLLMALFMAMSLSVKSDDLSRNDCLIKAHSVVLAHVYQTDCIGNSDAELSYSVPGCESLIGGDKGKIYDLIMRGVEYSKSKGTIDSVCERIKESQR